MGSEVVVGARRSPSRRAPYGAVKDQLVSLSLEIEVRRKTGHEAAMGESYNDQREKQRRCTDARGATAVVSEHPHIVCMRSLTHSFMIHHQSPASCCSHSPNPISHTVRQRPMRTQIIIGWDFR